MAEGNQAFVVGYIAIMRDEIVKNLNGTIGSSSAANFDGYPSILFSASGSAGRLSYDSAMRIVVTDDRMYQITAVGTTGKITKADIDRFHGSFKLAAHAPVSPDAFRTISFNQFVCGTIPSSQAGGKIVTWKKETVAGLPALQIVADVLGSRVYMLYLGNVQSSSNAMLLNYYRPKKSGPADDKLWARFVEGIKKAE